MYDLFYSSSFLIREPERFMFTFCQENGSPILNGHTSVSATPSPFHPEHSDSTARPGMRSHSELEPGTEVTQPFSPFPFFSVPTMIPQGPRP